MSKGYLVFYKAELYGVLEDKDEYKRFRKQRGDNGNYDFVKLDWEEILKVVSQSNLGCLQPVVLYGMEDIVIFANEYEHLIEYCYIELEGLLELFNRMMMDVKEYIRLDVNEMLIMNGMIVMLNKLINDRNDNGLWFEDSSHGLNLRPFVDSWIASYSDEEEF